MALVITHLFVSAVPEGTDPTVTRTSDWNAEHALTGVASAAQGGTGVAYFTVAGPTAERVYTFPDAAATMLYAGGPLGTPSSGTLTNATGLPEAGLTLADNTTNNFSTTAHGFVPKGTNVGNFLKDDGTWAAGTSDISGAWPVGSVFISVVSTNPGTLLGFGTWAAFGAGRVLVGIDATQTEFDTVEETGGAKTHTLTATEMPAHTHVQDAHTHTQNSHNHTQDAHTHNFLPRSATTGSVSSIVTGTLDTSSTISGSNQPHIQNTTATNQAATAANQNATATNQNTGGGGAHNNLQPYITVYMFKRTA